MTFEGEIEIPSSKMSEEKGWKPKAITWKIPGARPPLESFSVGFLWSQFQISFYLIYAVIRVKTIFFLINKQDWIKLNSSLEEVSSHNWYNLLDSKCWLITYIKKSNILILTTNHHDRPPWISSPACSIDVNCAILYPMSSEVTSYLCYWLEMDS